MIGTVQAQVVHGHFVTSDGLRLHYLEAGSGPNTILFIPGWLMPAAIFQEQLATLGGEFRVLALDPRSQGESQVARGSHGPEVRLRDLDEFLAAARVERFILAGWSLGVLESLDYVARRRPTGLAGMILIDNSIGEGAPPAPRPSNFFARFDNPRLRSQYLKDFCESMFRRPPPERLSARVIASALRVPPAAARQLIAQPYPRTYWRDTVTSLTVPVFYAVTPRLREQSDILREKKGEELVTTMVFEDAGHALFVDAAEAFNRSVSLFARRIFAPREP